MQDNPFACKNTNNYSKQIPQTHIDTYSLTLLYLCDSKILCVY